MQRIVLVMAASVCLLAIGAAAFLSLVSSEDRPAAAAALNIEGSDLGGPFTLVDHTGAERTSAEVIDRPTLIYFGYTFCPDVCPVDTQNMVDIVDALAERGVDSQPVFITIDPERDDVATMAAYAEIMHPKMIAMTGDAQQIETAKSAYKVYAQKVQAPGASEYLMNHTAFLYFADPTGLKAVYRRGSDPGTDPFPADLIADDIVWALAR